MTNTKTVQVLADLEPAYQGSYYTILGAGGDLDEWVVGVTGLLTEVGIGTPTAWFLTAGAAVNEYAGDNVEPRDQFQPDLPILMFPLDGLDIGKLAMFKIQMGDRWFDDVIDNMRKL